MDRAHVIVTDSGGVQEEAPSLGKPVLVMRETAERPEAVESGTVQLVGMDEEEIVSTVNTLLDDPETYERMFKAHNPYGDGQATERILKELAMSEFKSVCVVGLGYIGLPTASLLATKGVPGPRRGRSAGGGDRYAGDVEVMAQCPPCSDDFIMCGSRTKRSAREYPPLP